MNSRDILAFILGGLGFMVVQPILAQLALIGIVALLLLVVVTILLPGGWVIFSGVRTFTGFFRRFIAPFAALSLAALLVTGASLIAGPAAGMLLAFLIGGLAGLLAVKSFTKTSAPVTATRSIAVGKGSKPSPVVSKQGSQVIQDSPKKADVCIVSRPGGWFGRSRGCIYRQAFDSGVIVFGEASIPAARVLVDAVLKLGRRVVVIGSPYMAASHAKTHYVPLGKTSINVLKPSSSDKFGLRRWAENIAVPLAVAAGLDTAEAGMVIRFLEKFRGSRVLPDDVDKLVAEYGPTGSARLKDALGMLTQFFGEGYPEPDKLFAGDWQQLVIDLRNLSQASQLFIGMYLLYDAPRLFQGCVIVLDSAELGLPELQLLPYDARHVWLRTLKTVERLRGCGGFVISSSTGLLAPELLDLAGTYIVTRGPSHVRRELSERIGVEVNPSSIPVGYALVYTRATPDGRSYLFEGELLQSPVCDLKALEAEAERKISLLREELLGAYRDTLLYADFADYAEHCYSLLRTVKRLQSPTSDSVSQLFPEAGKALKMLLEKQYLMVDPGGVLGLTALGEQALKDWESKSREEKTSDEAGGSSAQPAIALQTGLGSYTQQRKPREIHDVDTLVARARKHLLRGDSLAAVGIAYKAAVTSLKKLLGEEKGHLPDLAAKAAERGVLKISEEEARKLYAANIEAKRLSKQVADGQPVSEEDRKRMADAAELLISLAERVAVFSETLADQNLSEEVSGDG